MYTRPKPLYIAAPFSRKAAVLELVDTLKPLGYVPKMRWLGHEYHHPGGIHNELNYGYAKLSAEHDLEDAENAELMVVLIEPHEGSHYGWLVELGIGLAASEEVWLVGPRINVFGFLSGLQSNGCYVRRFDTIPDLLVFIAKEKR